MVLRPSKKIPDPFNSSRAVLFDQMLDYPFGSIFYAYAVHVPHKVIAVALGAVFAFYDLIAAVAEVVGYFVGYTFKSCVDFH